jgi:plasmid stability protein
MRDLEEDVKMRLKRRARHGRSIEEGCDIPRDAVNNENSERRGGTCNSQRQTFSRS